jgi:hypothetical protein
MPKIQSLDRYVRKKIDSLKAANPMIYSIDEQDNLIQLLSVKELRAMSQKRIPISFEIMDTQEDLDEISLTMDAYIQNLQLKELKQLVQIRGKNKLVL